MQLLYCALSSATIHPLSKSKLHKFRHYETVLLTFLIIALLFFLIFQNMQLNQKIINSQTMQSMMQEMLEQKLGMVFKQIEDLKKTMIEQNQKIIYKQNQNRNIILAMSKQLGLPFYERKDDYQYQPQQIKQGGTLDNISDRHFYEIIQYDENTIRSEDKQSKPIEQDHSTFVEDQEQTDPDGQEQQEEKVEYQDHQICTYLDYLLQKDLQPQQLNDQTQNEGQTSVSKFMLTKQKFNFSHFPEINHSIHYIQQNYETQMHFLGHIVLIIGFIYGLLMFVSFVTKKGKFKIQFSIFKGLKTKNADYRKKIYKS